MGQQQLLLLVLSTVIVGLATVAGIQAFSENQAQATQDALIQRATETATDALAAHNKPSQMGGVDLTNMGSGTSTTDVANAIGLSTDSGFDADGAGESASCEILTGSGSATFTDQTPVVRIKCSGSGAEVQVGVDPDGTERIQTAIVSTASV